MLIQPDTNIKLLRGCPLDNRYEHTLYFESEADQRAYFVSLAKHNLTKHSYQRYGKGVITVQLPADDLFDCNYLMFQNASYSNKWFYAFITSVEYVNNVSSRVYYEIDVMQTWFWSCKLGQSFVVREHSETDDIGDNLVKENINFGPYVYEGETVPEKDGHSLEDMSAVIMYNPSFLNLVSEFLTSLGENQLDGVLYNHHYYSGVYHGVNFLVVPFNHATVELLDALMNTVDFTSGGGLLSCFMMPTMLVPDFPAEGEDPTVTYNRNRYNKSVSWMLSRNTRFGNYIPKNNKLFTYPYTCAYLTSNRGKGNEFAFEYFPWEDQGAMFTVEGNLCANPSVMAYPFGYKGVPVYLEGAVEIPSYPICTWAADGVTEWINNNLFKSMVSVGASTATALAAPATAIDYAVGVAANEANLRAVGLAQSVFEPGSVNGGARGDILFGNGCGRQIYAKVQRITDQYARIVDEYFTRFGYATNLVKIPNINKRPYWNYVQTAGCNITGPVPADDLRAICSIFDRGITFWKSTATIGDYTPDNSPKGVE